MVSLYVMCVIVMQCMVQYREMCYGICICNVFNVYGEYCTVERNVLLYQYV